MKLLTVIGARPQFIKAAPFSREFRRNNTEILVHTGQHYDANMSEIFFNELGIPEPDYNLSIGSASHGKQTGKMLEGIEEILLKEKPDGLMVYGDTNSTIAGALAASKLHIPVFHVEAGLRSYNKLMPEEQNRILTDHISDLLLCPTQTAIENLKKEGVTKGVYFTGDIMYDAVLNNVSIAKEKYAKNDIKKVIETENKLDLDFEKDPYYLATVHRAENTDNLEKLTNIFKAFNLLDKPVVLPIHPRTKHIIETLNISKNNILLISPVGYLEMLYLTSNASMVITDSGGLQKEAYFLKTPCTTLRDQTEWVETLGNGWNVLSNIVPDEIVEKSQRKFDVSLPQSNAFGDGKAAEKICKRIEEFCFQNKQ